MANKENFPIINVVRVKEGLKICCAGLCKPQKRQKEEYSQKCVLFNVR